MITKFKTKNDRIITFESKSSPDGKGFYTRVDNAGTWDYSKNIIATTTTPGRRMNERIWHIKLRKTYVKRGDILLGETVITDLLPTDIHVNDFKTE